MKFPLRSRLVCAAGLLYLVSGCPAPLAAAPWQDTQTAASADTDTMDESPQSGTADTVVIPGPLRSFLRMAGISREIAPEQVLPLLARNATLYGYQDGRPTEFLVLVDRYVRQAREVQQLADANGDIRIAGCADADRLIQILGYRFQRSCGTGNAFLVTANAERAFLTIDSGFPLTTLEQDLAASRTFVYSFPSTRVPILFKKKNWAGVSTWNGRGGDNLLDDLLHDQNLDRLYAALANGSVETRNTLVRSPGLKRLSSVAPVLDLYGREISIRAGAVVVPAGGETAWEEMVGASPTSPGNFVIRLLSKDKGWLAAYFDVMSRLNQAQQAHFADAVRLKRLYGAYRSTASSSNAAHGVFPKDAELLVLLTSLKWDSSGAWEVPGGVGVWQKIFSANSRSSSFRDVLRRNQCCENPETLLEALVAASNLNTDDDPAQIFLMLAAIDSGRPPDQHLSDATNQLIAAKLARFSQWFPVFAEFPALDDTSVTQFVHAADQVDSIGNPALRANALAALQAEIGLWRILAHQNQIPKEQLNSSWHQAMEPYLGITSSVQLFEAARDSLKAILVAAAGKSNLTQDQIVDLLAGPAQQDQGGQHVHDEIAARIRSVLDDQRLASLDSLFGLYDGLSNMAHGAPVGASLLPLAENLREFEMPRPIFTNNERTTWSPIVYTSRHAELQVRTDLTRILRSPSSPARLESARGQLTPFLRDTLVGLNYAYYEPPGAEVLHNNPLFVRSHDFSSSSVQGLQYIWGVPQLIGVGATAGGGAYLVGSLADLPYALASIEEDFIAPKNIQALIWKEVVPDLLVAAVLPRWWTVSPGEMHAATLYQRTGEEILLASAGDPDLREKVLHILSDRMSPDQMERVEQALRSPEATKTLVSQTLPSDSFYLAKEMRKAFPQQASNWGDASRQLEELVRRSPSDSDPARVIADFGVPHPTLQLTNSCTLINMRPFSAFGGNASRLLAESWESNNLYWARLADEMGYSPVMLNILVPALTRRMVANIFASNVDDWRALSRAMRETGDEFRQGMIMSEAANDIARQ